MIQYNIIQYSCIMDLSLNDHVINNYRSIEEREEDSICNVDVESRCNNNMNVFDRLSRNRDECL